MENINLVIGNNLKYLRKQSNMTQQELADKLNYTNKAISRWESGEIIPDVATLNKICEIFNVPIANFFDENLQNQKPKKSISSRLLIGNKLAISLLAVLLVFFVATLVFVYSGLIFGVYYWQSFLWAVPFMCIVGIVFNSIWGKKIFNYVIISILIWSTLLCIFIALIKYNIWPIFIIGIPMQIATLLWSNITINNQKKNK